MKYHFTRTILPKQYGIQITNKSIGIFLIFTLNSLSETRMKSLFVTENIKYEI